MQFTANKIEHGEYNLSGTTLEILYLIHKKKTLGEIQKVTSLETDLIKSALKTLIQNSLITQIQTSNNFLGQNFLDALQINLAKAIGPLADFLIEDAFRELEININKIPKNQAASIIRSLSVEIKDDKMKLNFMKQMSTFLK